MGLILRNTVNRPLTWTEGDANFSYLLTNMSGSTINITGSTINIASNGLNLTDNNWAISANGSGNLASNKINWDTNGNLTVTGSLVNTGGTTIIGATTISGSLNVTGSSHKIVGTTTISGSLNVSGSVHTIKGTSVNITSPAYITGSVNINGLLTYTNDNLAINMTTGSARTVTNTGIPVTINGASYFIPLYLA